VSSPLDKGYRTCDKHVARLGRRHLQSTPAQPAICCPGALLRYHTQTCTNMPNYPRLQCSRRLPGEGLGDFLGSLGRRPQGLGLGEAGRSATARSHSHGASSLQTSTQPMGSSLQNAGWGGGELPLLSGVMPYSHSIPEHLSAQLAGWARHCGGVLMK
jgi:hypothetical protein